MKISVIIPVLNEEKSLPVTISALNISNQEELIVVDGGSSDETVERAKKFTNHVISAERGRGKQLQAGARAATGDILFFIHADCIAPDQAFSLIHSILSDHQVAAGAFDLGINSQKIGYRLIEKAVFFRNLVTRLPYGDQGLFLRREVYEKIGGFGNMPLMEDIDIVRRLKSAGKIAIANRKMIASPRRWEKEGLFYTTLRDWMIALLYTIFKTPPEKLLSYYKDVR